MGKGSSTSALDAVYARELMTISAGYRNSLVAREEGSVWGTGLNVNGQLGDFTTENRSLLVQAGLGNYYAIVIGDAKVYDRYGSTVEKELGPKMPNPSAITVDQMLWIDPNDLIESYSSGFNLIDTTLDSPISAADVPSLIYESSDEQIAKFEQLSDGRWYLVPTGDLYGRITITITNPNNNYKGTYEIMIVPQGAIVSPMVTAGINSTVALRGDGTVWMWGQFRLLRDQATVAQNNTTNYSSAYYTVTYEYPTQVTFDGLAAGDYIIEVAAGDHHFLALDNKGNLYGWGSNDYGQLGLGTWNSFEAYLGSSGTNNNGTTWKYYYVRQTSTDSLVARKSPYFGTGDQALGTARSIAAGTGFSLVVTRENNQVWSFGTNKAVGVSDTNAAYGGQIGIGVAPKATYVTENLGGTATTVSPALVLQPDTLYYPVPQAVHSLEDIGTLTNISSVAAGANFALALRADGTVYSWGSNASGQLGNPEAGNRSLVPVQVAAGASDPNGYYIDQVTRIAAGTNHGVALKKNGQVYAWGYNGDGQLGNGSTQNQGAPVQCTSSVVSGKAASQIAAGDNHTLMRLKDGTGDLVVAWGQNTSGQLGIGTNVNATYPTAVVLDGGLFHDLVSLAGGYTHSVLMDKSGAVYMMGSQGWGKYNAASSDPTVTTDIRSPGRYGSEAYDQIVWIAGADANGIGVKQDNFYTLSANISGDAALDAGANQTMSIPVSELYVDSYAAFNLLTTVKRYALMDPAALIFDSSDPSVATAALVGGNVVITGHNVGRASIYITYIIDDVPHGVMLLQITVTEVSYAVSSALAVPMVDTGLAHTVSLKADGTVYAWGANNYGQLGDGTTTTRSYPVQVMTGANAPLTGIVAVAAGYRHSLALDQNGHVWAWGDATNGAVNANGNQLYARMVMMDAATPLSNVGAVTAGGYFSVALDKTDGSVWFWGLNKFSEIRDMAPTSSTAGSLISSFLVPQKMWAGMSGSHLGVLGDGFHNLKSAEYLTNIVAVEAGYDSLRMLRQDGSVFALGENTAGTLGTGYNNTAYSAVGRPAVYGPGLPPPHRRPLPGRRLLPRRCPGAGDRRHPCRRGLGPQLRRTGGRRHHHAHGHRLRPYTQICPALHRGCGQRHRRGPHDRRAGSLRRCLRLRRPCHARRGRRSGGQRLRRLQRPHRLL